MLNITKTIYNIDLMLAMLKGEIYTPSSNTILNNKFDILKNDGILKNEYPTLKYFAIGNGGLTITDDDNAILKHSPHTSKDAALFSHIPFVVREVENDITLEDKLKYRFRLLFIKDNKTYVAYYLKVIPNIEIRSDILTVKNIDGRNSIIPFDKNDTTLLDPVPRDITEITTDNKEYVIKASNIDISLTVNEIEAIKDAYMILQDKPLKSITEIALCTGIDRYNGLYYEASNVQCNFFISTSYDVNNNIASGEPMYESIDIGGMEPLIVS